MGSLHTQGLRPHAKYEAHGRLRWQIAQSLSARDTLGTHCKMKVNWAPGWHTVSQRTSGAVAMMASIVIVIKVDGAIMMATAACSCKTENRFTP